MSRKFTTDEFSQSSCGDFLLFSAPRCHGLGRGAVLSCCTGTELCGTLFSCISSFIMSTKDMLLLVEGSLPEKFPQAGGDCTDSKVDVSGDPTCCSAASFLRCFCDNFVTFFVSLQYVKLTVDTNYVTINKLVIKYRIHQLIKSFYRFSRLITVIMYPFLPALEDILLYTSYVNNLNYDQFVIQH